MSASTLAALTSARALRAARRRKRPSTPLELARRLDPSFVVTPTIRLLSDVAVRSVTEPDQRTRRLCARRRDRASSRDATIT